MTAGGGGRGREEGGQGGGRGGADVYKVHLDISVG